jgi:hypothetical protein
VSASGFGYLNKKAQRCGWAWWEWDFAFELRVFAS